MEDEQTTSGDRSRDKKPPEMYQSKLDPEDPHVSHLMKFNDVHSSVDKVYAAIRYWKNIADELITNNVPMHPNERNMQGFTQELIDKAYLLDDFLDLLITKDFLREAKNYQLLRVMLAQGELYLDFKEKMSQNDCSLKCNSIWENDAVAYRCNTCALTPCMSLCEKCFEGNGHKGHDFTRFFSREGGACDCGNDDVLKPQGFCSRHGPEMGNTDYNELDVSLPKYIVLKLLVRLFLEWRGWKSLAKVFQVRDPLELQRETYDYYYDIDSYAERDTTVSKSIVEFLQECVRYGGPMRVMVANLVIDKELYRALTEKTVDDENCASDRIAVNLDWRTRKQFEEDKTTVLLPDRLAAQFPFCNSLEKLECKTLLDELMFWIIREVFPQNAINFALSMLSETQYRDEFAIRFFKWYPLCSKVIKDISIFQHVREREERIGSACSRIIHVSVQMLSSAVLCKMLDEKCNLISTLIHLMHYLLTDKLTDAEITLDPDCTFIKTHQKFIAKVKPTWKVLNFIKNSEFRMMETHGYWYVMGDLQNLLAHNSLAIKTVCNTEIFGGAYVELLKKLQGMRQLWRIVTGDHVEHDSSDLVQRAYTLEFEIYSVAMYNMASAIQMEGNLEAAVAFTQQIRDALDNWLTAIIPPCAISTITRSQAYTATFHLPLHRHLSIALTHFLEIPGFQEKLDEILLQDEEYLRLVMLHPLKIQSTRAEIGCGMWVRNGAEAKMLSHIYCQWNVTNAFINPDFDLLRYCFAHIDKRWLMKSLMDNFCLDEFVNYQPSEYRKNSKKWRDFFSGCQKDNEDKKKIDEEKMEKYKQFDESFPDIGLMFEYLVGGRKEKIGTEMYEKMIGVINNERVDEYFSIISDEFQPPDIIVTLPELPVRPQGVGRWPLEMPAVLDEWLPQARHKLRQKTFANVNRTQIVLMSEWCDPLMCGMLKLIAELVVIRVNNGISRLEHIKMEIANVLAHMKLTHSRVRGAMSEKGTKGSETLDKVFEQALSEVANFMDADAGGHNRLQQGVYILKPEVWEDICPMFILSRSTSMRTVKDIFSRLVVRDKANAKKLPLYTDIKEEEDFFIPFKLIDFDKKQRSQGISEIYKILITQELLGCCMLVLYVNPKHEPRYFSMTEQLAIYLLTLGAKFIQTYDGTEEERQFLANIYHTPFAHPQKDEEENSHTLFTIFSYSIALLEREAKSLGCYLSVLKKILSGEFDQTIVRGGFVVYMSRFLSIIASFSSTCRTILQEKLDIEEIEFEKLSLNEVAPPVVENPAKLAAKEQAKQRMMAIMDKSRAKGQATMAKLMAVEGVTKQEVDQMDTKDRDVKLYDCPICGDLNSPNSLEKPFGMLVQLSTNFIADEQIPYNVFVNMDLMEVNAREYEDNRPQFQTRRWFNSLKRSTYHIKEFNDQIMEPVTGTELKTCGHTAHLECFNAYRQSVYIGQQRRQNAESREVNCPICRFVVNTMIPLTIDRSFLPVRMNSFDNSSYIYDSIQWCCDVMKDKKFFTSSEDVQKSVNAFRTIYGVGDYDGFYDFWQLRNDSERRGMLKECTESTTFNAIVVATVERCVILRRLGIQEQRKNTRKIMTEHLLSAEAAFSKPVDYSVVEHVSAHLFLPLNRFNEFCHVEKMRNEAMLPGIETSYATTIAGLERMDIDVLEATTSKPRDDDLPVTTPIFMYEPKAVLTRMMAYVADNKSISSDAFKELSHKLVESVLGFATIRTLFRLLMRTRDGRMDKYLNENLEIEGLDKALHGVAHLIMRGLNKKKYMYDSILKYLVKEEDGEDDQEIESLTDQEIVEGLELYVVNYLRYAYELLYHFDIVKIDVLEQLMVEGIGMSDALKVAGIDAKNLRPAENGRIELWVNSYREVFFVSLTKPVNKQPTLMEPIDFKPRFLLQPPDEFDVLFNKYFHQECHFCSRSPPNPMICLLCSKVVCIDPCCRTQDYEAGRPSPSSQITELETHAESCSSSSGVFLSLNSSLIIIVRGQDGAIWGSVYLDAHGEEDRNLRRGKPLQLNMKRWRALQRDWFDQEWQRVSGWHTLTSAMLIGQIRDHFYV